MNLDLLRYLDIAALAVIWWCSASGLVGGPAVRRVRDLAVALGLIGAMVFSFVGLIYLSAIAQDSPWWATGLRVSGAVLALIYYEQRFGIARHARMLRDWWKALPACLARRWAALRQLRKDLADRTRGHA